MSVLIFCPFFDLGVFRVFDIELHELLYIVEVNPLSVAFFANIFSHSEGCIFVCGFLCCAKAFLSLIKSHLFIFIFITLEGESKKIFLGFMSKTVLLMFSSKSFIMSRLSCRSSMHFEFTFVYGVRECSNFIHLHVAIQFSPGEGNGNPLQYSCLENPMDRGAWWDTVHGITKSQTRLSVCRIVRSLDSLNQMEMLHKLQNNIHILLMTKR